MTVNEIVLIHNRIVDFGPPMVYPEICKAYTVEKMTLWQHSKDNHLELVAIRAKQMPQGRIEGTMYDLTNEEVYDLDKKMGVGVKSERKRLPFYIPFQGSDGEMCQIYAYVYIGMEEYWIDRISYGGGFRLPTAYGDPDDRSFSLVQRVSDGDKLLHNRFCFVPEPVRFITPFMAAKPGEGFSKLVKLENEWEAERQAKIAIYKKEQEEIARKASRQERWDNFIRKIQKVINDDTL